MNSLSSVDILVPGGGFGGDPAEDVIIPGAPLLIARALLTANTLPDGTILAAGGFDGQRDLDSAEVYDPFDGSSFTPGRLTTARHNHLGMTLPGNGNVVIIGGISGTGSNATLASCELYNFPEGNFTPIGSLTSPRARATAIPVADGLILSAGGVSTDGIAPVGSSGVLATPAVSFTLSGVLNDPFGGTMTIKGSNLGAAHPVNLQLAVSSNVGNTTQAIGSNATTSSTGSFTAVVPALSPTVHSGTWTLTASTNERRRSKPLPSQPSFSPLWNWLLRRATRAPSARR